MHAAHQQSGGYRLRRQSHIPRLDMPSHERVASESIRAVSMDSTSKFHNYTCRELYGKLPDKSNME
jgi:hypothetical protein